MIRNFHQKWVRQGKVSAFVPRSMSNQQGLCLHRRQAVAALGGVLAVAIFLASLLPATGFAGSGGCRGSNKMPAQLSEGELQAATLCLINQTRHRHGLGSLNSHGSLRKAAARHSADMVRRDYFSHYSPGGGSIQTRIGGSGYLSGARSYQYGEVIGGGTAKFGSPASVMSAWMHSGSHRAAILTGAFNDAGVGVAKGFPGRGSSGATFTVDFGRRSG
jgi:uncharacterized protein YkwD